MGTMSANYEQKIQMKTNNEKNMSIHRSFKRLTSIAGPRTETRHTDEDQEGTLSKVTKCVNS